MHLYYLFASSAEWTNLDEALLRFVSDERRKRINSCRLPKVKKQSLYAALLLPFACTDQYDLAFNETDPIWPEKGKPFLRSHPEIHFSIAHSDSCAAVAVSDKEIGLDAELIAEAPMKALKRAFSREEAVQIQTSDDPNLEFFRIWTRKEAYGKFLGTGLSGRVLKTNTLLPEHDRHITEGILTLGGTVSRAAFLRSGSGSDISPDSVYSPALYCSVYGKETPADMISVSEDALMEYFLFCV